MSYQQMAQLRAPNRCARGEVEGGIDAVCQPQVVGRYRRSRTRQFAIYGLGGPTPCHRGAPNPSRPGFSHRESVMCPGRSDRPEHQLPSRKVLARFPSRPPLRLGLTRQHLPHGRQDRGAAVGFGDKLLRHPGQLVIVGLGVTAQQVRCFRYGNIENRAEESFGLLDDDCISHHRFQCATVATR